MEFKLQKVDELLIAQHSCLEKSDYCYFLGEYVSRKGYEHSPMNQLIFNLKKSMDRKEKSGWCYKRKAIEEIADFFNQLISLQWRGLKNCTWVPFPPSKTKEHSEYDSRLLDILNIIKNTNNELDIRELLETKTDRNAAHLEGKRLPPEEHVKNLRLVEKFINPIPKTLIIFDDVITSGASFKAAQKILKERFVIPVVGIFIARAINI